MHYDHHLHQAIHSFFDSNIYLAVTLLFVQVILFYHLLGDEFDRYFVIFILIYWIVQVEVLDIYYKLFAIWGVEESVTMEFVYV